MQSSARFVHPGVKSQPTLGFSVTTTDTQ